MITMANTNTDLTEEDAADLQFPKDSVSYASNTFANISVNKPLKLGETVSKCVKCRCELIPPYILCAECDISLCSACFAKGVELLNHRNDHDYHILNNNFLLFENSDWTAKEELTLLDAILNSGNWNLVAKQLPNRSVQEIKEHYDYFYLQRHGSDFLPALPETNCYAQLHPIVPYRFRLTEVEEPPRYAPNSVGFHSVAGYNAGRSDFELEYDSNAEDLVANLKPVDNDDPHYNLLTDLHCGIVKSYNRRLSERQRRKSIIRIHGLILIRKTVAWLHRYDMTITKRVYERMLRFMQYYSGLKFNYLMEGLHHAGELKIQISRLCDFHKKGITTLEGAHLYLRLKQDRENSLNYLKTFQSNSQFNWKMKNLDVSPMFPTAYKRRGSFAPLDVVGLPGYEKLLPKEQDLCKTVRLVPLSYIELKDILVAENKKLGYLKLQTARRLLKIDVNKTRKLYDFLVQEGYVSKPDS